jgi:hypothetical protein
MAAMIIRSWICDNSRCGQWFDSYEPNPACPKCGCVRVSWRPAGGHIGGQAKGAEKELRALADIFKMTDMNSAQEGQAAKKVNLPAPSTSDVQPMNFGGFAAAVDPSRAMRSENPSGAQCVPTVNRFNVKAAAGIGHALPANSAYPGIRSNTRIEGVHKA